MEHNNSDFEKERLRCMEKQQHPLLRIQFKPIVIIVGPSAVVLIAIVIFAARGIELPSWLVSLAGAIAK